MKKLNILGLLLASSMTLTLLTPAEAAYTVKPKVGQCFLYTVAEVSAAFASKNPINCKKTHNMETYIVAKWPLTTPPEEMADGEGLEVANSLCMAWGKGGKLTGSPFTFWAWYTPDPAAWARGERWLRCDAMITVDENEPRRFVSWKGLKLKNRTNL